MARYFFDVLNGGEIIEDGEGQEHVNKAAARRYAWRVAREQFAGGAKKAIDLAHCQIRVRDWLGVALFNVNFGEAGEKHTEASEPSPVP
jgi:hypothetical protein